MKPDINSKIKVTRPSTSKNSNTGSGQGNFFHSKDNNVYSNSSNMGHNSTS